MYTWQRYRGYEVSSKGDKRFSAFNAILSDGRSIEQHYQCDVKGYDIGGTNWRLGKGKPPKGSMTKDDLWNEYLSLWILWAKDNYILIQELKERADKHNKILSDRFASTSINQARALSYILNNL